MFKKMMILALGTLVCAGVAHAGGRPCGGGKLMGTNVGLYNWDAASGTWVLSSTSYSAAANYYVAGPEDTWQAPSYFPNDDGGGGGPLLQSMDSATRKRGAIQTNGVSGSSPCELPTVVVTATAPSSGGMPVILYRIANFFGGGGGSTQGKAPKAPNNPNNQNPATCTTDNMGRSLHAAMDFALWRLKIGAITRAGNGERVTIEYDDGGTEIYMWIPGTIPSSTQPPDAYIAPVPGTLRCPS